MIKQRIDDQIDALEDMKDSYNEIIDLKKESLDAAKEESDYQDEVSDKVKEIAELQERINALSLDDSRDSQAQRAELEKEMYELQKDLADKQADYAIESQKEALDNMADSYSNEKDKEIENLEDSISSYQKLYDMAIAYIESHWDTLYNELINWNTQYGDDLNSELTSAWENALAAAKKYGSYVSALNNIGSATDVSDGDAPNYVVSPGGNGGDVYNASDMIHAIVKEMYLNSQLYFSEDSSGRDRLSKRNAVLGSMLSQYGITAVRGEDGAWYIDTVGGTKLFDKYSKYIYHNGGIVGNSPTLKQTEVLSVLEKGEAVLDEQKEKGLFRLIDFTTSLSDAFSSLIDSTGYDVLLGNSKNGSSKIKDIANISKTNNNVHFGNVYIYGSNEETIQKHQEINRKFTNEVLKNLKINSR